MEIVVHVDIFAINTPPHTHALSHTRVRARDDSCFGLFPKTDNPHIVVVVVVMFFSLDSLNIGYENGGLPASLVNFSLHFDGGPGTVCLE